MRAITFILFAIDAPLWAQIFVCIHGVSWASWLSHSHCNTSAYTCVRLPMERLCVRAVIVYVDQENETQHHVKNTVHASAVTRHIILLLAPVQPSPA
jgi:hypothetical protein